MQISQVTLDNASSCDTMVAWIGHMLHERSPTIAFTEDGNRIR